MKEERLKALEALEKAKKIEAERYSERSDFEELNDKDFETREELYRFLVENYPVKEVPDFEHFCHEVPPNESEYNALLGLIIWHHMQKEMFPKTIEEVHSRFRYLFKESYNLSKDELKTVVKFKPEDPIKDYLERYLVYIEY